MKSFRDRNPYAVGIASVLLIGIATLGAFLYGILKPLDHGYTMHANFSDAAGLHGGDAVKIGGVKVGAVEKVTADRANGLVRIEWKINEGVEIHESDDLTAAITLETLLGSKYLKLTEVMGDGELLSDLPEDRRFVRKTEVPYDIFELTKTATEGIEQLHTDNLNELINQLATVTEGQNGTVADLSEGITRLGQAINTRDQQLASLIDRAEDLSGTLADKDDELVELIDASREILDLLVDRRNQLASALGESADVVVELTRVISDNKTQLDNILDNLAPTLDVVAAEQDDLDRALAWLGPGLLQQSAGGMQGPWQDIFIRGLGPDVVQILADLYGTAL